MAKRYGERTAGLCLVGLLAAGCSSEGGSETTTTTPPPVRICSGIISELVVSSDDPNQWVVEKIHKDDCAALLPIDGGAAIGAIAVGDHLTAQCDPGLVGAISLTIRVTYGELLGNVLVGGPAAHITDELPACPPASRNA